MTTISTMRLYIIIAGISFLLSSLFVAMAAEHYLRISSDADRAALRLKLRSITENTELTKDRASLWYGTVVSVSEDSDSLIINFEDRFVASPDTVVMQVAVRADTNIVKQSLLASNNVYIGFTEKENIPLSAIQPGNRVSAKIYTDENGQAVASVLIVGGSL